jgi:hypothetical protein
MVMYLRGHRKSAGDRRLSIADFHDKFNGIAESGGRKGLAWQKGLSTYLQSFDAESGKLVYNLVKGVHKTGRKPCLRIATIKSGAVTLTYDHPVLMSDGTFKQAGELEIGDTLLVRGSMLPRSLGERQIVQRKRVVVEGLKHYPHGWVHRVTDQDTGKVYEYQRTHRARLVVEARMNGIEYDAFVDILKRWPVTAEKLVYLDPHLEVHHQDEDPTNDVVDNLCVMTKADHTRLHSDESRFNVDYTEFAEVIAIEDAGERETYDVEMASPFNNFVVNDGIIVHNTGKSAFCKALGNETERPTLLLDVGALMGGLVGQTEENVRRALSIADAMAPCILMVDEIEKSLAGATGSNGDSGVSARLFGTLLTWLNDHTSDVFVVCTANDVSKLPPEFSRAFHQNRRSERGAGCAAEHRSSQHELRLP